MFAAGSIRSPYRYTLELNLKTGTLKLELNFRPFLKDHESIGQNYDLKCSKLSFPFAKRHQYPLSFLHMSDGSPTVRLAVKTLLMTDADTDTDVLLMCCERKILKDWLADKLERTVRLSRRHLRPSPRGRRDLAGVGSPRTARPVGGPSPQTRASPVARPCGRVHPPAPRPRPRGTRGPGGAPSRSWIQQGMARTSSISSPSPIPSFPVKTTAGMVLI